MKDSGEPDVCHAELFDFTKRLWREIPEFTYPVFFDGSPRFVGGVRIADKCCKKEIDNYFVLLILICGAPLLIDSYILKREKRKGKQNQE